MQNTQPTAQPTCVDTHTPSPGSSTLSIVWPSREREQQALRAVAGRMRGAYGRERVEMRLRARATRASAWPETTSPRAARTRRAAGRAPTRAAPASRAAGALPRRVAVREGVAASATCAAAQRCGRWISSIRLPAGSAAMPITIPVLPNGIGSRSIVPPAALTAAAVAAASVTLKIKCATVSLAAGVALHDHDLRRGVCLRAVDVVAEVQKELDAASETSGG